jgi:glycosyltransferase involved in cell wall biosynthesis
MKISFLTVTHERPEFMPWLLFNFERQSHANKELIIVDSSAKPCKPCAAKGKNVTVIHAAGLNVPAKRNMAMDAAKGDYITWLDDDDWRHPDSAKILAAGIGKDTPISGGRWGWFVNLQSLQVRRFCARNGLLNACLLAETSLAASIRFDENQAKGSDIDWLATLLQNNYAYSYEPLAFFLSHKRNLGNVSDAHYFNRPLADVTDMMTKAAWGKTGGELEILRRATA